MLLVDKFFNRLFLWEEEHTKGFLLKVAVKTPFVSEDEILRALMVVFKKKNLTELHTTFWKVYGEFCIDKQYGDDGIMNYQFKIKPIEAVDLFTAHLQQYQD